MTKKTRLGKISPFAALCLCSGILSAADPSSADVADASAIFRNLAAGKTQSVIVYGTSLTEHGAWANALKEWFDAQYPGQVTFTNSGGSGKNSKWGVSSLEKLVLPFRPDMVFIEFSYNDATKQSDLSLERCGKNLDKIVQAIRSQNPDAVIVLQVMNPAWDAPNGKQASSKRPNVETYNNVYRDYARKHRLALLDHYPIWESLRNDDPEKFRLAIPDGSHPNPDASMEVTWPSIQSFLERSRQSSEAPIGSAES